MYLAFKQKIIEGGPETAGVWVDQKNAEHAKYWMRTEEYYQIINIMVNTKVWEGLSPLQFGVVLTFNLLIGIITPPVGIGLYAVCAITGLRLEAIIRTTAVFLPTLIFALLVLTYVPFLSTWLPAVLFPDTYGG